MERFWQQLVSAGCGTACLPLALGPSARGRVLRGREP